MVGRSRVSGGESIEVSPGVTEDHVAIGHDRGGAASSGLTTTTAWMRFTGENAGHRPQGRFVIEGEL